MGQLESWGHGELHLCKGKQDSAFSECGTPSLHAQQEKHGEAKSWGDNWAPQNYSYTLQVSISLSVFHKTLVLPTRCSSN